MKYSVLDLKKETTKFPATLKCWKGSLKLFLPTNFLTLSGIWGDIRKYEALFSYDLEL